MAKMFAYSLPAAKPVFADLSDHNEKIVETAGFIPLDVKFKRFEQNGLIAQFNTSEFTSNDFRNLYANPDFEIYPDDEFEEIEEKIAAYNDYRVKYMQDKKLGDSVLESPSKQAQRGSVEQKVSEKEETSNE